MVRTRASVAAAVTLAVVIGLALLGSHHAGGAVAPAAPLPGDSATSPGASVAPSHGPNVIVIVADDLDNKLMRWMPNVRHLLVDQGASFRRYYVEQSLCCPSRATILSGQYSHNTGVQGNHWPEGGFLRWRNHGERTALPTWLAANGYRNAEIGKYINDYPFPDHFGLSQSVRSQLMRYVPPGWSSWFSPVRGTPYRQTDTYLNVDGRVDIHPRGDYLDQVFGDRLLQLVRGQDGMGFRHGGRFVYYASYSPHQPYAAPARYGHRFRGVSYPRTPNFDEADVSDKFGLTSGPPLAPREVRLIDQVFRQRIRSVQVLDQSVGRLVRGLRAQGTLDNTYILFTSDNGYHMGEHRLTIGKYRQFEEDVRVPLVVRGPGIAPGTKINELAGTVDIAPTIADLTGTPAPSDVDGESLVPLLTGRSEKLPRDHLLITRGPLPLEQHQLSGVEEYPERQVPSARLAFRWDFNGVVTQRWKYVAYTHNQQAELYDLQHDPYELHNLLPRGEASLAAMSPAGRRIVHQLQASLHRLLLCRAARCRF